MNLSGTLRRIDDFFTERRLLYTLLSIILIILIAILVISEGFSGATESLINFKFSRWAFSNPEFFLNNISKPLFTILSSPFALLGFKSFQLFNILLGIASGYVSFLVAKELKIKSPILAIVICCFTPIFMVNLFSGITEILFAFTAILATYFLVKEKYISGAIIVSFLPIIKTEGFLLILIYTYYFVHKKHYKEILYTLTAFVFFSIVGTIFGKNFFWLLSDLSKILEFNPNIQGSLFQFAKRSPGYFGIPNEIFFVTGLLAGLSLYIRQKKEYSKEFFLVVLPFIVYFSAHSLSFWSGIGGSLGNSKYMAAIVPFMAVMATRGLYIFAKMFLIIFRLEWARVIALIIGIASVTHIPFVLQNYPLQIDSASYAVKTTSDWLKSTTLTESKIYFNHPSFYHFLDIKPSDSNKIQLSKCNYKNILEELNHGDLIVYDGHYSTNFGLDIENLASNPNIELLRVFNPTIPMQYRNKPFIIAVFRKTEPDTSMVYRNRLILSEADKSYKTAYFFDFDKVLYEPESKYIGASRINPNKYLRIRRSHEYYLKTEFTPDTISAITPLELLVEMKLFLKTPDEKLKFVIDAHIKDRRLIFKEFDINTPGNSNPEEWVNINFKVLLPEIETIDALKIQTYIWNKKKGEYLIDDYKISYRIKKGE